MSRKPRQFLLFYMCPPSMWRSSSTCFSSLSASSRRETVSDIVASSAPSAFASCKTGHPHGMLALARWRSSYLIISHQEAHKFGVCDNHARTACSTWCSKTPWPLSNPTRFFANETIVAARLISMSTHCRSATSSFISVVKCRSSLR